jgi:hypothetical protein
VHGVPFLRVRRPSELIDLDGAKNGRKICRQIVLAAPAQERTRNFPHCAPEQLLLLLCAFGSVDIARMSLRFY